MKNLEETRKIGIGWEEMNKMLKVPKGYYVKKIEEDTGCDEDVYWIVTIETCL